jgi:hypothetical protein
LRNRVGAVRNNAQSLIRTQAEPAVRIESGWPFDWMNSAPLFLPCLPTGSAVRAATPDTREYPGGVLAVLACIHDTLACSRCRCVTAGLAHGHRGLIQVRRTADEMRAAAKPLHHGAGSMM